jgi:hypothetical protein
MSLPSSERLPSDINDLPPARQRHIRRQPRSVSLAERQILLNSLIKLTAPTPAFFARALLGSLALGGAFYLHNLVILIVAIVILPFPSPLFGLALYPVTLNSKHALKSLVSLLMLLLFTLGAGALAGLFQTFSHTDPLGIYRFTALYWLDLTIVVISAFLSALTLLRQGKNPQGLGVLLSYTLLVPFAVFGFGLGNGNITLWSGALFVGVAHAGLAVVLAVFSFLILGYAPKKGLGWLVAITILIITLTAISVGMNFSISPSSGPSPVTHAPTPLAIVSETSLPQVEPSPTYGLTATQIPFTATWTSSPSPTFTYTPTATFTPEPAVLWGVVDTEVGAVIRESPDFDAAIITYANNNDQIEILGELTVLDGKRWFEVLTESGQTGWLLGSLVRTQTPTPTE